MQSVASDRYSLFWTGFIYDEDGECDAAAAGKLLNEFASGRPLAEATAKCRGNYFVAIADRDTPTVHCTVDDSSLYSAYRSSSGFSTSFLGLCRATGTTASSFDRSALIELLHLGNVYFGDTLAPGIRKIASNEVVVSSPTATTVTHKSITRLSDQPIYENIVEATDALAKALSRKVVSVDLTGGVDSRMLACLLTCRGVDFECALSGTDTNPEVSISRLVAESLDRPFHFTEYDGASLVDDLDSTLQQLDGMGGALVTTHRLRQLNQSRIARGVNVSLKGSGGELYKDFFWTQDFPFYRSRKTRMARLHRMRIEFEQLSSHLLTPEAFRDYQKLRDTRCRRFVAQYLMPVNTQSYDNVYFYERVQTWNSRLITSTQDPRIAIHAPLCELKVAQLGFSAPRSQRLYNRFHRSVITQISPATAKIKTTEGTTASCDSVDMSLDLAHYAGSKAKKLAKKLSQLLLNKTIFSGLNGTHEPEHWRNVLESDEAKESLQALKDFGILRKDVDVHDVGRRFQEHMVAVGWTLRHLR